MTCILGVAGRNADNARRGQAETDREVFMAAIAGRWKQLDPQDYPFLREIAGQLPGHDDREQFPAGLDVILAGMKAARG